MQVIDLSHLEQIVNKQDFFLIDKKIVALYPLIQKLVETKKCFLLDDPEKSKSLECYERACEFFLENGITRQDTLNVIGGGATSDLGGFVAATILRGVPWNVYPTTFLSMIDASIGGKVGINTELGKNLIGSFHYPSSIYFHFNFLDTLEEIDMKSGKGELIKYLLLNPELVELSDEDLILGCAKYKNEITKSDFRESGERKKLNLGHTFGHAFEKMTNLSHGECVAWGLKLIVDLYRPQIKDKIASLLKEYNFESFSGPVDFDLFNDFLERDKKRINQNEVELIIPNLNGGAQIKTYDLKEIRNHLKEYSKYEHFFK